MVYLVGLRARFPIAPGFDSRWGPRIGDGVTLLPSSEAPFIQRSRVRATNMVAELVAGDVNICRGPVVDLRSSLPSAVDGTLTPAINETSNLGVVHR